MIHPQSAGHEDVTKVAEIYSMLINKCNVTKVADIYSIFTNKCNISIDKYRAWSASKSGRF